MSAIAKKDARASPLYLFLIFLFLYESPKVLLVLKNLASSIVFVMLA